MFRELHCAAILTWLTIAQTRLSLQLAGFTCQRCKRQYIRSLSRTDRRWFVSIARSLHPLLSSPALRFGSLALAFSLVLLNGLWNWASSPAKPPALSANASARLSMQELYDRMLTGDVQPVHDRIASLRKELPEDKLDWNYGNVAHKMMILIGLKSLLEEDDLAGAKNCLILASQVQGSPQLNTFGPNMLLAKALLERGEFETVERYLEHCRSFWVMGTPTLDTWIAQVRDHSIPDFGANIEY